MESKNVFYTTNNPKSIIRFDVKEQLGEGSFSKIFKVYDLLLNQFVALKIEKEDKNKRILKFEYEILKRLQLLSHVPKVFDFITVDEVENYNQINSPTKNNFNPQNNLNKLLYSNSNFIVMELLGQNIANFKKQKEKFNSLSPYNILLQMLTSIEQLHKKGFIHRDIKPTNFVVGLEENKQSHLVFMVDFGLAKIHLDKFHNVLPARTDTDFRGTLTYASLNAHYKLELARRDDLWSFFFVILDLLNLMMPWRVCKDNQDIVKLKEEFINNVDNILIAGNYKSIKGQICDILNHLRTLKYEDKPDYELIRVKLRELYYIELEKNQKVDRSVGGGVIFDDGACRGIFDNVKGNLNLNVSQKLNYCNSNTPVNDYLKFLMCSNSNQNNNLNNIYHNAIVKFNSNTNPNTNGNFFNNNQKFFFQNFINNYNFNTNNAFSKNMFLPDFNLLAANRKRKRDEKEKIEEQEQRGENNKNNNTNYATLFKSKNNHNDNIEIDQKEAFLNIYGKINDILLNIKPNSASPHNINLENNIKINNITGNNTANNSNIVKEKVSTTPSTPSSNVKLYADKDLIKYIMNNLNKVKLLNQNKIENMKKKNNNNLKKVPVLNLNELEIEREEL